MVSPDLVEKRQYAEAILSSLNVRPIRVDVNHGIVEVPVGQVKMVRKICNQFGWPLEVVSLSSTR